MKIQELLIEIQELPIKNQELRLENQELLLVLEELVHVREEHSGEHDGVLSAAVMNRLLTLTLFLLLTATAAFAQVQPHEDLLAIQDNSFLLEEAYNQGMGVVQHIGVFTRDFDTDAWAFAFTQEYPFLSPKHQLSYSIPVFGGEGAKGLGDIALNYRYQLVGDADSNLAITPRLSLILPTQDEDFGDSSTAVQGALAVSRIFAPRLIGHTNVGVTWVPDHSDTEVSLGQSFIYAPNGRMQLMLEGVYTHTEDDDGVVLSPGIRWVHNLKNGFQVVPGVGFPLGLGDDDSKAVLLYLSFER